MPWRTAVQRIYNEVHAALWALLIVFVLYFLATVLPQLPARRAEAERLREQAEAAENIRYCERWGMPAGTRRNSQCTFDLRLLRTKIERDLTEELTF
jgi:hypothetical protein